jgi:hypothetical protein
MNLSKTRNDFIEIVAANLHSFENRNKVPQYSAEANWYNYGGPERYCHDPQFKMFVDQIVCGLMRTLEE